MKTHLTLIALLGAMLLASSFDSMADNVVSISTTVKGNQEHPSVTYIIPWRQASDDNALTMPFTTRTRLGDVFDHVERVEHEREVSYLVQMQSMPHGNDLDVDTNK